MGMTGEYDENSKGFGNLTYMVCRPENNFFPDLSKVCAAFSLRTCIASGLCLQALHVPVRTNMFRNLSNFTARALNCLLRIDSWRYRKGYTVSSTGFDLPSANALL